MTNARHGFATSYAPAVAARHRLGQPEIDFAKAQRAKGCGWAGIAAQLGCSEPDIRALVESQPALGAATRQPPPRPPPPLMDPLSGSGLQSRLRAVFGLKPAEAALMAELLTPAGSVIGGSPDETREWRGLVRDMRPRLGAHGLADAVEHLQGSGFLITRDKARRLRAIMLEVSSR